VSGGWTRHGVVVPPAPFPWARTHAALPVAQLAGDALRLYLSSRDERGRSRIGRVELEAHDGGFRLGAVDPRPAIDLGPLGAYDDNGVTSSCLVERDGRLYQYFTGWTLAVTVPFAFFIGCAISDDGGETWQKASRAPVLGRSEVDPFLTASPWVLVEGGRWRMWYVSCMEWTASTEGEPRHRYLVRYAESADGLSWEAEGRVAIDFDGPEEYAISRPCVVREGDGYRMWFSSRGDAYRIRSARSRDGLTWTRDPGVVLPPQPGAFDASMTAYPLVVDVGVDRHLFYNGDGYGATGIGHARWSG
jgi:hypothetical protein